MFEVGIMLKYLHNLGVRGLYPLGKRFLFMF